MVEPPGGTPPTRSQAAAELDVAATAGRAPAIPLPQAAPEIGFSQPVLLAFGLGVALMILTGLFRTIVITSDAPSEGLADTSVWFGWLGATILSLTLIAAGLFARQANLGVRTAFILVGTYLFLHAADAHAGILSAMASFF